MKGISRGQRKEQARMERKQALQNGSYFQVKKKRCRNRSFTLSMAMVLFMFALMGAFSLLHPLQAGSILRWQTQGQIDPKVMFENKEDFLGAYDNALRSYDSHLQTDKTIRQISYPTEEEISMEQVSTSQTNSLISVNLKDGKIVKIGVVGIYQKDNDDFALGFKENMVLVTMIALDLERKQAEQMLSDHQISSSEDLFLQPKIFQSDNKEFIFHVVDKSRFYFTIENKTKMLQNQ